MNKLSESLLVGIVGLVVLTAAGPTISRLVGALVPLILVAGIAAAVLQLVHYYTRR